jgi:hypothetical protein
MNESKARAFIIDQLGKNQNRNDILLILCRELDIEWKQAERLVQEVEASDGRQIARRQSPLLLALGLAVIIGGLALTTYGVWYFWTFTQLDPTQQLVTSQYMYITAGSMITGLAMIVGGIIGFRKILAGIL